MSTKGLSVAKGDHTQGDTAAKLTLIEYGDYQCPSCAQAFAVVKRVQKHFGDRLLFAFRNFPLEQHEFAETAAEAAEFAATQGKFWEMHDLLYKRQRDFSEELFPELASEVGLDRDKLVEALESGEFEGRVEADYAGGEKAGVEGTPTFYANGHKVEGGFGFETLVEALGG